MVEFRAMSVQCYSASIEFFSKSIGGHKQFSNHATVRFTAISRTQAVADAIRFWSDRQKTLPEYFKELLAIKVSLDRIGPIDGDGRTTTTSSQFFEWKCDFPASIEGYLAEFERKEKSR